MSASSIKTLSVSMRNYIFVKTLQYIHAVSMQAVESSTHPFLSPFSSTGIIAFEQSGTKALKNSGVVMAVMPFMYNCLSFC